MINHALFLHGGPGYTDYLAPYFAANFEPPFHATFYSQRQRGVQSVEDLVAEVGERLLPGEKTILVGHSWGGALATEYVRRRADARVAGLVLIASFLCGDDVNVAYEEELVRRGLKDPTLEQVFLTEREIDAAGDLIPRLEAMFNPALFERIYPEFVKTYDARDFVGRSHIPVLNIFGEDDLRVPSRRVRLYGDLGAHVINYEIKGAGHFPFLCAADHDRVVRGIHDFMRRLT